MIAQTFPLAEAAKAHALMESGTLIGKIALGGARSVGLNWRQIRALARLLAGKLRLPWSPEQVAGWLKRPYPDDTSRHVSPETIYRSLVIQAHSALKM